MGDTKSQKWIRAATGIRYLEHPTRRHGVGKDRYYVLRYTVDGKGRQEPLGWASEGVTLEKARLKLAELKEAKRTGKGAKTLKAQRELAEAETKAQAEAALREQQRQIRFGQYWEETYWPAQGHKAHGSKVAEMAIWKKWLQPVLAEKPILDICASDLEKIKSAMMKDNKSSATIKYAMAVISQVWTMASKAGIVTSICPTKQISLPKKDNKRQRYLSSKEANQLLEELAKRIPIAHDMAIIALDCGLRFGEIASLSWQDINFEKMHILIRDPKARANRYAFMTTRVKNVLENRRNMSIYDLVFTDKNGNQFLRSPRTFRRIVDELFNIDVVDPRYKVCFHTLRHTFASRLVEGGTPLYNVKELMGHSDFTMTQRYSHLSPEGLREAVKILETDIDK